MATTVGHGELRGRERPVDVVGDSRGSRGSRSPGSVVSGLRAKTADLVVVFGEFFGCDPDVSTATSSWENNNSR